MKTTFYLLAVMAIGWMGFTGPGKKWKIEKHGAQFAPGKYMEKTEISNLVYREFLDSLRAGDGPDLARKYEPDTSVWSEPTFTNPYVSQYFTHPAFHEYPVVGITREAAEAFCTWRTELFARSFPNEPKTVFRLPTESEWTRVARANMGNRAVFSGGWYYPRSEKGKFVFNHKIGHGDYAGLPDGHPNDWEGYMITAPVLSFPEDASGIYNLSGNVAEMVAGPEIAKGGSWYHEAKFASPDSALSAKVPHCYVGFRCLIERSED